MSKRFGGLYAAVFGIALLSAAALAGEGGSSHVLPGTTATLVDLPPSVPGTFFKPMYLNYDGSASVPTPTAAGIVADLEVTVDTLAIGGGHTFETTVLGGRPLQRCALRSLCRD